MFDDIEPCQQIKPCLYLGSASALRGDIYFSMVINCTMDIPFSKKYKHSIRVSIHDDLSYNDKFLEIMENTDILSNIHALVLNHKPVLVHCYAGIQRSCSVVACYLIRYYNMTVLDAVEYIKKCRPCAFSEEVVFMTAMETFRRNLDLYL
jgi:dual specificity MAP kinase phosphatase